MKVHFIAIGGSAMHNLALALYKKDYIITGSDDEIFEPSKSRLAKYGLLPEKQGWFPEKIHLGLDAVVLGMHAREDNPELLEAKKLGIKIFSYPEFLYEQTKNKTRIVIGGSHGKTTITSMVMHVLKFAGVEFDYMVGANVEGFETMVNFSRTSKIAVFEGDEYLSSPIDKRPKFHLYKPNIALISGIAWDHINVFPTFEIYVEQFRKFIELIENNGSLIYFENDKILADLAKKNNNKIRVIPYNTPKSEIINNKSILITKTGKLAIEVFGEHNLQNISGAKLICNEAGISDEVFYKAISNFKGAAKRLQLLAENTKCSVYLDFAHSPSKLEATVKALKKQFAGRKLVACMELHTFSSLTAEFLNEYKGTMKDVDFPIVFFNPETIKHKKLPEISTNQVLESFDDNRLKVFNVTDELVKYLKNQNWSDKNLLMMSSGNFSGIDFKQFANEIISL
ncbi:MAG: peptidoglycan synthetase [Bacteroidetes bacterium GWA2_30_7]|nr:MAG: peptidoglycan synthetase [Bacteroidetes bacterium GWA2_30_7]